MRSIFIVFLIIILLGCRDNNKGEEMKNKIKQCIEKEDIISFEKILKQQPSLKNVKFDGGNETLLHIAAGYNFKTNIIEILLKAGANINEIDIGGDTALHKVCYSTSGKINIIRCLINNGAKVNIKNNYNETPLDMAYKSLKVLENTFSLAKSNLIENYSPPSEKEELLRREKLNNVIETLRFYGAKTGEQLITEKKSVPDKQPDKNKQDK